MATKRGKAVREHRVALGADVRIGRVREVFDALAGAGPKATVVIGARDVAKVDAAALRALATHVVQWRTAGRAWRWDNPTETLRTSARSAGLDEALGLE